MNKQIRWLLLWLWLAACLIPTSGCAWGNAFFQMDSNSNSPFFGFNLLSR